MMSDQIKPFIKLADLFKDYAVLQREMSVPVWGWTLPSTKVTARIGSNEAQTISGADGKFILRLPPMKAGGPHKLEVRLPEYDVVKISRDIRIGEVWLASGQSNMEYTLAMIDQNEAESLPDVRMAKVINKALLGRQSEAELTWMVAGPEGIPGFSAVAYHFARELHKNLDVPVGIINSSWGGTIIEAWTSRETLVKNPEVRPWIERYEADIHSPEFWMDSAKEAEPKLPGDPGNLGVACCWAETDFDDSAWNTMKLPSSWNNRGHKYSGVFWFRKTLELPAEWAGKDLIIGLGAVDKHDITYFNGEKIGSTGSGFEECYWNYPRVYRIPGHLVRGGKNVISVRVYSFAYDGGLIGPGSKMKLKSDDETDEAIELTGEWKYKVEHNFGIVSVPTLAPGPGNPNSPYILYDNLIAPLVPYAIRGVIWYQGESNEKEPQMYLRLMKDMIRDWRHSWGQGDFPFLMTQLANYNSSCNWAYLREAQLQTLSEPHTGMAVTVDIGDADNIHPVNKKDVGKRLALWALSGTYGRNLECSGPLYSKMTIEGDRIRIYFTHTQGGLMARDGALRNFLIADQGGNFVKADAIIDENTVVVCSARIKSPMAVRYAWESNPEGCNLYNGSELPASPFRTDNWQTE